MARAIAKGILGTKLGMTQIFDESGKAIAVTVVEAGPCVVLQKKTKDSDGYEAIQVGFKAIKEKKVNKPLKGHFTRANVKPVRYIREFRVESADNYEIGQEIKVDVFTPGDVIDVTGTSKGKGFAGGIKRHGFHRGPSAHGSKYHRRPGSLAAKGPARVFPGRKGPGRLGGTRVTTQNLTVARVYPEKNLILVKGAIPGPKRALVTITNAAKA